MKKNVVSIRLRSPNKNKNKNKNPHFVTSQKLKYDSDSTSSDSSSSDEEEYRKRKNEKKKKNEKEAKEKIFQPSVETHLVQMRSIFPANNMHTNSDSSPDKEEKSKTFAGKPIIVIEPETDLPSSPDKVVEEKLYVVPSNSDSDEKQSPKMFNGKEKQSPQAVSKDKRKSSLDLNEEQKLSPISAEVAISINIPQHHVSTKKAESRYVFRKILVMQSGLSGFFTGNFITQKTLNYFDVPKKYMSSISPTMGGLLGAFSSLSFLLGSNNFIEKKSFQEKDQLLNEIKHLNAELDLLERNLQKYERNKNKKISLQKQKKLLEEKKSHKSKSNKLKSLFTKKTSQSPIEITKANKELCEEKEFKTSQKRSLSIPSDRLGVFQAVLSGYFAGSSITTNLLAFGGIVSMPASIVCGIGMSALFGITTFYTTKNRQNNHQTFINDKIEVKNQQERLLTRTHTLEHHIKKIKKQETPQLPFSMRRRSSAPEVHSNNIEHQLQTLAPNTVFEEKKNQNLSVLKMSISPFPIHPLQQPQLTNSPSQTGEISPFSTISPSFAKSLSFMDLEENETKAPENPPMSTFNKLRKKWDGFKTNHLRLFRTVDITQATLSGFAAGYSITAQFLKLCKVSKNLSQSIPSIAVGIGTSALYAISSYQEKGEYIVSKELFDAEKRSLKKQQKDLKNTVAKLHKSLEKSHNRLRERTKELKVDLHMLNQEPEPAAPVKPQMVTTKKKNRFSYGFFTQYHKNSKLEHTNLYYPKNPEKLNKKIKRSRSFG